MGQPAKAPEPRRIPGEEHLAARKGSDIWQIRFSIGSHRFRESSGTATKIDAGALALKRWQEEWDRIKLGVVPKQEMTLNRAFSWFYLEKAKGTAYGEGGQKFILRVILETLGPRTLLSELTDAKVNDMIQAVRVREHPGAGRGPRTKAAAGGTINRYLAALSAVCKRAREVWHVEVGDWSAKNHRQRESQNREVFLDHEQARRLVDAATGHLRPILLFSLMTGLRRANVLGLQWEQVSMDMGRAVLIQKGDRRLGVTLPPQALELLRSLRPALEDRTGPVFVLGNPNVPCGCSRCLSPGSAGKPLGSVKKAFQTAAKAAGLRDMPAGRLRIHDLRHTAASWLLAAGGDLQVVKEVLGHSNIATTGRYVHLLPGRKETVVADASAALFAAPVKGEC